MNSIPSYPTSPPGSPGLPSPDHPALNRAGYYLLGALIPTGAVLWWLGSLGQLSELHLFRILAILGLLLAGQAIGLWSAKRGRWLTGLCWMSAGLAGAALAWWFCPTTEGLSYWSAR